MFIIWHTNGIFQGFKCDLLCWCPLQNRKSKHTLICWRGNIKIYTERLKPRAILLYTVHIWVLDHDSVVSAFVPLPLLSLDCFGTPSPAGRRWSHRCSFSWTDGPHLERNTIEKLLTDVARRDKLHIIEKQDSGPGSHPKFKILTSWRGVVQLYISF